MRAIRNGLNETVVLSIRTGDSRVHIDFVEGLHPMRRMADLGVQAPLYAGAASKVLLAPAWRRRRIGALSGADRAIRFPEGNDNGQANIASGTTKDKDAGLCGEQGELFTGGGGPLAAAMRDFHGKTVAVIDILTPEHR